MTLPTSAAPPQPHPGRPTILVVEDDEMVGEVVRAMLQMGGFESTHVKGPMEALEVLRDDRRLVDLLLTDFRMPGMSGIELIQRTKKLRPEMKTVLYSGNADLQETANYPIQPDHFLRKPFTAKTLNDLLWAVLARRPPTTSSGPGS